MTMMFLHEVGHAFGAHLLWPDLRKDDSSYRAAETDADWGAGRMFAIGLLERGMSETNTAHRLIGSATVNHIALELRRVETAKYHLPQQRLIANVQGATSALSLFDLQPDTFRQAVGHCDANMVWMYRMLGEQFKRNSNSKGWFCDQDVQADRIAYDELTIPRILELRARMSDQRIAPT